MSVIKQISIFNGSSWDPAADIGANAENIDFTYTTGSQAGSTAALSSILPAQVLTVSRVLTTDSNGKLSSSSISSGVLNTALSGASTTTSLQSQINTLNTNLVHKSGDNMTGALTVLRSGNNDSKFAVKNNNITVGGTQTEAQFGNELYIQDSNEKLYALFRTYQTTDGINYAGIHTSNRSSVSATSNSGSHNFYIGVKKDGTKVLSLDSAIWKNTLGITSSSTNATMSTSYGISGNNNIRKINGLNLCYISLSFTATSQIPSGATIATIPTGYRPSSQIAVPAIFWLNNTVTENGMPYAGIVRIDSNGAIHFDGSNTTRAGYISGFYGV